MGETHTKIGPEEEGRRKSLSIMETVCGQKQLGITSYLFMIICSHGLLLPSPSFYDIYIMCII